MDDKLLLRQVSMITGVLSDLMKEVADIRKRIVELEKGGSKTIRNTGKRNIVDMYTRKRLE